MGSFQKWSYPKSRKEDRVSEGAGGWGVGEGLHNFELFVSYLWKSQEGTKISSWNGDFNFLAKNFRRGVLYSKAFKSGDREYH